MPYPTDAAYLDRLRQHVAITEAGCWEWNRYRTVHGYGRMRYQGRMLEVPRLMLMLNGVTIPPGMEVMHDCDNPPCCNPAHLRIGTHAENVTDMVAKGRRASTAGERNPRAVVTAAQAHEIRTMYAAGGKTQGQIGALFGISNQQVSNIVRGFHWSALSASDAN